MLNKDQNLKLSLEINRAMSSQDADRLIDTVTAFMEQNRLRARPETIARLPVRAPIALVTPDVIKEQTR